MSISTENDSAACVLNSRECFEIVSAFWGLLEVNVRSKATAESVVQLFTSVLHFLKLNWDPEAVSTYVHEQLYLGNLRENELLDCQMKGPSPTLVFKKTEAQPRAQPRMSEDAEKAALFGSFSEVSFERFFRLLAVFAEAVIIDDLAPSFVAFWEYVFARVVKITSDTETVSPLGVVSCPQTCTEELSHKNIKASYVSEDIAIDRRLIYESAQQLGYSKCIGKPSEISQLGETTKTELSRFALQNFVGVGNSWQKFRDLLFKTGPIYVFYCIKKGPTHLRLNPAIFDKFLFEEVRLKDKKEKNWVNLFNLNEFLLVDHETRFAELLDSGVSPYYKEKLEKLNFELEKAGIGKLLFEGHQFAHKHFGDFAKGDMPNLQGDRISIFNVDCHGIETKILENEIRADPIQDIATGNPDYNRLLEAAHKRDLRILIIGKPFARKTAVGSALAKVLGLDRLDVDAIVTQELKKIEETAEELKGRDLPDMSEEDKAALEADRLKVGSDLAELEKVANGEALTTEFLDRILRRRMNALAVSAKGFVIEFPSTLFGQGLLPALLGEDNQKRKIDIVLNLKMSRECCLARARNSLEFRLEKDGVVSVAQTSEDELEELRARAKRATYLKEGELPDPVKELVEGLEPDFREFLENAEGGVDVLTARTYRADAGNEESLREVLESFDRKDIPDLQDFILRHAPEHIPVEIEGLSVREIVKRVLVRLGFQKSSVPAEITEVSNIEGVLEAGKTLDAFEPRRQWSFFKSMDCVEFVDHNSLKSGATEFAVNFENFAFLFSSEANKLAFMADPKKYLKKLPVLNGQFNVLVMAPEQSDLKNQAKEVAGQFGLQFVDMAEFIEKKVAEMEELKEEAFQEIRERFEGVSLNVADIFKGLYTNEPISSMDIMKLFLLEQKVPLEIKFDEEEETKILSEKSDPKAKKKPASKAIKNILISSLVSNSANVRSQNDFYDKMRSAELPEDALKKIPAGPVVANPITPLKGFLFFNLGLDKDLSDFLAETGVEFYKIFSFFNSDGEEGLWEPEPSRMSVQRLAESFEETRELLKATVPETAVVNFDFRKDVVASARALFVDAVDQFKDKIDSDELKVNYNFDPSSMDGELMNFGLFGRVCPVHLVDNNWYLQCKPEANSLQISGDLYCFSSETAKNTFRKNYQQYLQVLRDKSAASIIESQRRVFVLGCVGSGVSTVCNLIANALELKVFDLKKHILAAKTAFIKEKLLNACLKSSFKPEELAEQMRVLEACRGDVTTAIDKYEPESAEVDEKFEEDLVRTALIQATGSVIVLNFHFSENERLVFKSDLKDIIFRNGLIPDKLVILRTGDFTAHNRIFKPAELKEKWGLAMASAKRKNDKKIAARRLELLAEKQQEDPSIQIDSIEVAEGDVELEPEPNVEEEIEKENAAIKEKRDRQNELINEFLEALKEYAVPTIQVNTELSLPKIAGGCLPFIRETESAQVNQFHRSQISLVADHPDNDDLSVEKKLQKLVGSRAYSLSEFGLRDFGNPKRLVATFDFNVVYKRKIYFFESEKARQEVLRNPLAMSQKVVRKVEDLDLTLAFLKPIWDGPLRQKLKTKLGVRFVSLQKAIQYFFGNPKTFEIKRLWFMDFDTRFKQVQRSDLLIPDLAAIKRAQTEDPILTCVRQSLSEGTPLTDDEKVYLVWALLNVVKGEGQVNVALEDFPENTSQLHKLAALGVFPNLCFTFNYDEKAVKCSQKSEGRFLEHQQNLWGAVHRNGWCRRELEEFVSANFSNLFSLNFRKSADSNLEIVKEIAERHSDNLIRAINCAREDKSFPLTLLPVAKVFVRSKFTDLAKVSLSERVTRRSNQVLQLNYENLAYFKGQVLADDRPESLNSKIEFHRSRILKSPAIPVTSVSAIVSKIDLEQTLSKSKFDMACPVCLSFRKAVGGQPHLVLQYTGSHYFFCSLTHLHKFSLHPVVFNAQRPLPALIAKVRECPVVVSHEKQVIGELTVAMNHICKLKLKYPGMSIKESALSLLAIFLKYRNPFKDASYRRKYELKLNKFISDSQEVERIGSEMDQNKKSFKNFEMKFVHQRIDEFLKTVEGLQRNGREAHLRLFIE